jgi:hypothetical protein
MAVDAGYAWSVVQQIYADVGHTAGADEQNDLNNRIRDGQTLEEIIANTYDDAQRRFKTVDTPASRASDPTAYDAQLNQGVSFQVPSVMLEQLAAPAREQAAQMAGATPLSLQRMTPTNTPRYNTGPAPGAFGGGDLFGLGGLSMGTLLLIGGGVLVAVVLFRKFGKK